MKSVPLIVKVDSPCSENWQNMLPNNQGRYCSHCSKTVIDFTKLSDAEIIKIIEERKGNLCGRLSNDQLERPLLPIATNSKSRLYKVFASLLFIHASNQALANSNMFTTKSQLEVGNIDDSIKILTPTQVNTRKDSTKSRVLKGVVINANENTLIAYATITIKDTKVTTITDENGEFSINVPKRLMSDSISLLIIREGFLDETFKISNRKLNIIHNLYLKPSKVFYLGGIRFHRAKKWWQFWK